MRKVPDWHSYFMCLAKAIALRSKDPNTQVGALIVDERNHPIAFGYNGFAPGVEESDFLWERPQKYDRVLHAEMNAIAHAEKSFQGATLYVTHSPCLACSKLIVASGIVRVIYGTNIYASNEDIEKVWKLLKEAGLQLGHITI